MLWLNAWLYMNPTACFSMQMLSAAGQINHGASMKKPEKSCSSLGKRGLVRGALATSISAYCLHGGAEEKYTIYILSGMSSKHSYSSVAPRQR